LQLHPRHLTGTMLRVPNSAREKIAREDFRTPKKIVLTCRTVDFKNLIQQMATAQDTSGAFRSTLKVPATSK
jgi:hypothetical protein